VIDSGAEGHVIAGWLARKLELALLATDHTTEGVAGRQGQLKAVEHPALEVDGLGALPRRAAMVIDLPEVFEKLGIGLVLSPQYLIDEGEALVIDLGSRKVWKELEATAFEGTGRPGKLLPEASTCSDPSVRTGYLHFVVSATVDGEAAELMVDTGADTTSLTTTSRAGKALLARYPSKDDNAMGGAGMVAARKLPPLKVRAGEVEKQVEVPVLVLEKAEKKCPHDGQLGLDVLGSCTLVLSRSRLAGYCR